MEVIDQESLDAPGVMRLQHCLRADKRGNDAAAMDIANEDDRHIRRLGKAHIGEIAITQIYFGRTAGALDDDEVGLLSEAAEAVENGRHIPGAPAEEVAGALGDGA